jgi:hypothetical protein
VGPSYAPISIWGAGCLLILLYRFLRWVIPIVRRLRLPTWRIQPWQRQGDARKRLRDALREVEASGLSEPEKRALRGRIIRNFESRIR